ncbi:unnamed protein product, partial [Symbiodinium sp. KB8]
MMKTLRPQEWKLGGLSTPPDGLCLVYCYLAACNPCLWMARARDDMGFFKDADTEAEVKQEAQALFQKAVDLMVSGGHDTTRLDKGGYPGEDEMPFFSDVFGCGILVQHEKEDCQPAMIYGTQPVGFEIMHVTSTDDAGHGRGHFVLSCTWMVEEPPVVVDRQSWRPIITGGHLKLDIDVPLLRKHGRSVALADKLDVRSVSWAWRQGFIDANISTYHQEVCLKRGPGHVLPSFKCSCPDWAQWLGICKHGVALLQALGAGCRYAVSEAGEDEEVGSPNDTAVVEKDTGVGPDCPEAPSADAQVVSTDLKLHGVKVGGIEGAASGDAQQRETEEAMPSVFTAQEVKKAHADNLEAIHTAHIFRAIEMLGLGGPVTEQRSPSSPAPSCSERAPDRDERPNGRLPSSPAPIHERPEPPEARDERGNAGNAEADNGHGANEDLLKLAALGLDCKTRCDARASSSADSSGYIFSFGQYKGTAFDVVRRQHPNYLDWLVANPLTLAHRPDLCRALRSAGHDVDAALRRVPPQAEPRRQQRPARGEEPRQPHHCSGCGATDHNVATCPLGRKAPKALASFAYEDLSAEHKRRASQLYTRSRRSLSPEAVERPARRARGMGKNHSLVDMSVMTPKKLLQLCWETGLVPDLCGAACRNSACQGTYTAVRFGSGAEVPGGNLNREAAHYRCGACDAKVSPVSGQKLFLAGHGATDPRKQILVYRCFAAELEIPKCVHMTGVSEDAVGDMYHRALKAVAEEVKHLEADAVARFRRGLEGGQVLDVEVDEKQPRMPILTRAAWKTIADEIFSASSHVSLFSDGCKAYTLEHEGVADHQAVNHNAQEYVRSCQVLRNWETGERTLGKAGCQKAEGAWKHINDCIPESIAAPVTEAKEKILDLHIRHGQWRYMTGSLAYDFEAFGAVAARYNKATVSSKRTRLQVEHELQVSFRGQKRRFFEIVSEESPLHKMWL